jgi:hypothetical protein
MVAFTQLAANSVFTVITRTLLMKTADSALFTKTDFKLIFPAVHIVYLKFAAPVHSLQL